MRILATGDHHFKEGPRFEECCRIHDWIADLVRREKPDLVLSGGDVYDQASTPTERLAAAKFFQTVANVAPVVIARGNHDRPRDLQILAELHAKYIIDVVEQTDVIPIAGALVAVCAWPSRSSNMDEEGSRNDLRAVLRGFRQAFEQYGIGTERWSRILLGHFQIDGSETGTGQPLVGGGLGVSLADLALAGADVVIAGHVHKAQGWLQDHTPILYTGSPFRTDYGEREGKSVLSIEIGDDGSVRWSRITTPARPMILLSGAYVPEQLGVAVDLEPGASIDQADIRLRYTVALEHADAARAHAETLRHNWLVDGAASVKIEREIVASTRTRSPEVAAAKTLKEKIRAHWEAKGDVPEAIRAERLLGRVDQLEGP